MERDWTKRIVEVPDLPGGPQAGISYEQCVVAGNLIFVAGQTGSPETATFEDQAREAFERIRRALDAAGAGLEDIVSMTVFLTDLRYGQEFGRIRKEVLGENLSTSAQVGVAQLWDPRMLVEIQSIAVRPG